MRWTRIILVSLVALFVVAWFQYTLPDRAVVRITGTEVIRTDFTAWNRIFYAQPDSGAAE